MSYDLQIYSCSEPNVELVWLAVEEGFERNGNAFSLRGKNWQLIFRSADKVEPEDIPTSVFRELCKSSVHFCIFFYSAKGWRITERI